MIAKSIETDKPKRSKSFHFSKNILVNSNNKSFLFFLPSADLAFKLSRYAIKKGYKLLGSNENMAGSLVFQELLAEKILVRNFSNHPALPGGIRLTIGTEDENIKIAATLAAICQRAGE